MLVCKEVIAQALDRHAPLLAHEAQVIGLDRRLHHVEAAFHLAAVREQGKHRTLLRAVHIHEQPLQTLQVGRVVRLGHVRGYIHRHMRVEVVARVQLARAAA